MAALTRARIEDAILKRCDAMMTAVGMNAVTRDGTNSDLDDPIRFALNDLGWTVADPLTPADIDLLPVTGVYVDRVLDGAELRVLETCWTKWVYVTVKGGDEQQNLSDLADRLASRIEQLTLKIERPYGLELTGASIKTMTQGWPRNNASWGNPMRWPYR